MPAMSLKKQEYNLSIEDETLLHRMSELVKPLTKKPITQAAVKLKQPLAITIATSAKYFSPAKQPVEIGLSGGLNKEKQRKMDQGKLPIDISIDLHGMTTERAFIAFEKAIEQAYTQQLRFMLVITGKGKNSSAPSGVLRHELPLWLSLPQISSKIIRASQASAQHGGSGAFYILIKRAKS